MSGFKMYTISGRAIDPMNLKPEDIDIEDIAHATSMFCRYGGHVREFYSVAQHSVLLAGWVEANVKPELAPVALLHDASEGYVGDMIRPLKDLFPEYEEKVEKQAIEAVFKRFNLNLADLDLISEYDKGISIDEMRVLLPVVDPYLVNTYKPLNIEVRPWPPIIAKRNFLARFRRLFP